MTFVIMLLLVSACKKDVVEKLDIPKEDRDIRVLKVQYQGHDNLVLVNPFPPMYLKECTYHYDAEGGLSRIENGGIRRANIEYNHEKIKVANNADQNQLFTSYWNNSVISFQGMRIENITNTTRHLSIEPRDFTTQDRIDISRTSDGRLKSVLSERSSDAPVPSSSYSGLSTEI